jgi:hypothetical protein
MAQDDVTSGKALRGGRQKANHIQVHRIELGLWERKNLGEPLAESVQGFNDIRKIASIAVPAVAAGGVYVAYKIGKAAYGWVDDTWDDLKGKFDFVPKGSIAHGWLVGLGLANE